jgi:hypothetical protein
VTLGAVLAVTALLASAPALATGPEDLAAQADKAFVAKEWTAALRGYEKLARDQPKSGLMHFRLGAARLYTGDIEGGMAELKSAESLGWPVPMVAYRLATGHAAAGRLTDAVEELRRAVQHGFSQVALADSDPLLAKLRADARWPEVRDEMDRAAHPCKHEARARAFDFWLGTWDVVSNGAPASTPPAENVITLEYGDCVVHEHWKSPSSSGESFNVFDASQGAWFQTWVDDGGGLHQYRGNPDAEGNMRYTADLPYPPDEKRRPTRLTFFKQGADRVRQLSERTTDGGATWVVNYDLIYTRRPGTKAP